ncbi:MAG: hypothetical protein K0Q77_356 [Anaerosporomusa subterranea]|jgi:hypothetical protein|nr:hypothetical protein [Anaerosporomusa subterranea]
MVIITNMQITGANIMLAPVYVNDCWDAYDDGDYGTGIRLGMGGSNSDKAISERWGEKCSPRRSAGMRLCFLGTADLVHVGNKVDERPRCL